MLSAQCLTVLQGPGQGSYRDGDYRDHAGKKPIQWDCESNLATGWPYQPFPAQHRTIWAVKPSEFRPHRGAHIPHSQLVRMRSNHRRMHNHPPIPFTVPFRSAPSLQIDWHRLSDLPSLFVHLNPWGMLQHQTKPMHLAGGTHCSRTSCTMPPPFLLLVPLTYCGSLLCLHIPHPSLFCPITTASRCLVFLLRLQCDFFLPTPSILRSPGPHIQQRGEWGGYLPPAGLSAVDQC